MTLGSPVEVTFILNLRGSLNTRVLTTNDRQKLEMCPLLFIIIENYLC